MEKSIFSISPRHKWTRPFISASFYLFLCHLIKDYDLDMSNLHIILSCISVKEATILYEPRFGGDVLSIRGSCDCRDGFYFNGNDCLPNVSQTWDLSKKFTPPDFQAKNFTPLISPNFNSFGDRNTKKWVKMEIVYTTGKNFNLPLAVTAVTNLTSESTVPTLREKSLSSYWLVA